MPLNNSSLGARKHGPGTNVAIMLMVRITGDSHYWHSPGLLCRADRPAAAASITVTKAIREIKVDGRQETDKRRHPSSCSHHSTAQCPSVPSIPHCFSDRLVSLSCFLILCSSLAEEKGEVELLAPNRHVKQSLKGHWYLKLRYLDKINLDRCQVISVRESFLVHVEVHFSEMSHLFPVVLPFLIHTF